MTVTGASERDDRRVHARRRATSSRPAGAGITLAGTATGARRSRQRRRSRRHRRSAPDSGLPGTTVRGQRQRHRQLRRASNVIAGGSNGFSINGSGHTFKGNFVGTDVTGTVLFGVAEHAFDVVAGTNDVIGGAARR